jgi:hypothetical protein
LIVKLSDSELAVATMVALARRSSARGGNVHDAQVGKQDPFDIDLDGMLAEMAFAKQFNYYPEFTVGPRSGGADFVGRLGQTIDVKATRHKNGRLLATTKKNLDPCDVYVLAIVLSNREIDLVGYANKEDLFIEKNLINLGHGTGYGMSQETLRKFKE